MPSFTIYLKLEKNTESIKDVVLLEDAGKVFSTNKNAIQRIKKIRLYRFSQKTPRRCVMSVLKIIELIQEMYPDADVQSVGANDILLEWVDVKKKKKSFLVWKVVFVALISFFGAAFTIMAYHNDVGVQELFRNMYYLLTGIESDGFTELEISYSIGLAVGIIVFFNHVGGRRITKDPSPIETEMFEYEDMVENALIDTAGREGKTIDVE